MSNLRTAPNATGIRIGPYQLTTATTTYTALVSDQLILADASGGGFTLTLPSAADAVQDQYTIKATSVAGGNVVVDGSGAETIDGAATKTLGSLYALLVLASDGTNWHIIGQLGTVI